VEVDELADGSLQGYSAVLDLYLRWAVGALAFYDPATGEPIATLESERQRRFAAEAHAETGHARAAAAEARVLELEERLRSRGG
jgi:hypothetical protein